MRNDEKEKWPLTKLTFMSLPEETLLDAAVEASPNELFYGVMELYIHKQYCRNNNQKIGVSHS